MVVTRPAQDARRWADALRGRGMDAVVLPLIAIGSAPDPAALQAAARCADNYTAVMFVSANAVQGFLAAQPVFTRARAWAPGPGTRDALLAAGIAAERMDAPAPQAAQFDSEALWSQVEGGLRPGDRLLVVRGADAAGRSQGRDWLTEQARARGVHVDQVSAYRREVPQWTDAERAAAQEAAEGGACWLFSSSEAAANLQRLMPGQDWSRARAIATHPRIAQAVRDAGFGRVDTVRPGLAEVVASIESSA